MRLVIFIVLCLGLGLLSGQFVNPNSQWFIDLEKPLLYPPGYLFGIVWSILYVFIAISVYLVSIKTKEIKPYVVFGIQLLLNYAWTFIFFGAKQILWALVEIIILLTFIIWTALIFKKYSKTAFWLLMPYLVWVVFATYLTISLFILN